MAQADDPTTTTRRNVLGSIPALALTGGALALPVVLHDPLLDLLQRKQAIHHDLHYRPGDIADDDPIWDDFDAVQEGLLGLSALTVAGALAAAEDVLWNIKQAHPTPCEYRDDNVDMSLMEAVIGFLRKFAA